MKIEIACRSNDSTKVKGDLLEGLAEDLLSAQSYRVIKEIRFAGMELDLLCKHEVSGREIYVECKAQSGNISAPILRQLIGTVTLKDYSEGWLLSTAEFGKDAKGIVEELKNGPTAIADKISFYTPDIIVRALRASRVVCTPPEEAAAKHLESSDSIGDWILLISPFGRFWAVYTLKGGVPEGVLFFYAKTGKLVSERELLSNIATLESVFCDYDVYVGSTPPHDLKFTSDAPVPNVVEVQTGDSWNDYRPARPQDFVGRDDVQRSILNFLENARISDESTRIFAITGNSGLGKSSLIAKLRDRTRNKHYKNKIFMMAIDMRGAKSPAYISASVVNCLEQAQKAGFGAPVSIQLTNPSTPLSSESITTYLESVKENGQFICLVFDQFEELYSKPDLYNVFTAAKDLMIDTASIKGAFGLGFAWKTDSTTQQDHPAYHIWHGLSDHRKQFRLSGFNSGEISKAITTFEKAAEMGLPKEIRHQISHSCQGFPWLLKKLCIHLFDNIDQNLGADSALLELDVSSLFQSDLETLNPAENTSLKIIASKAPADWSEIIETSGVAVVNSLVHKRLVVKSGDRLNIYWDIFRDYLLTGSVPVVPFNYVPASDLTALLKIAVILNHDSYTTSETLSSQTGLKEKSIWNIGADLVLFGVSERQGTAFKLHRNISSGNNDVVLSRIRDKIEKHSLKIALYREYAGQTVGKKEFGAVLKACLPEETYSEKTWDIYASRFLKYFESVGFLVRSGNRVTVQDSGSVVSKVSRRMRSSEVFSAMASPASACDALALFQTNSSLKFACSRGYRNSISVLKRFNLIDVDGDSARLNTQAITKFGGLNEAVWTSAKNEAAISKCIEKISKNPNISGPQLGAYISEEFELNWTTASMSRTGNAIRQWANWIIDGSSVSIIPAPPGRKKKRQVIDV